MFDSTGVAAGNNAYYLNIIPKASSVLISRIEAVVSDYGSDYYNVGISGGVKQEDAVTGVAEGTTVHINGINAGSFSFGGGYSTVEFNTITVYFVRTTPPCEHSFTGAYQNNSINHARKCVKCGEYGPAEAHSFTYQVSGNTVTATCSSTTGDCELTDKKAVLTLTAAGGTYDGTTAFPAGFGTGDESVWKAAVGTAPVILYCLDGNEIAAAPVNAGEYTAKITVNSKTAEITYTVSKATPVYTVPTGLTAEYGKTLKGVVLPAGFRWQDADTTPVGDVGEHTFKVTYTPEDTDNYNVVSDIPVTVTVSYADVTVSFNMNGHGTQISSQTVKHGDKAESPEAPLEAGWVFGGWYQDAALGAEFDFNNALNEDTEIYAKWTQEEQPTEGEIIISEEDGEWTQGKNMPLSFRLKAEAGKSACVLVDDILLDSANYTFESEPAALILKPSYLKTLSVGQHKLTIRTEDSETSRYFVIKAAGINPSWFLWLIPLAVIVLGILAIIYFRRKKKKSN